MIVLEYNKSKAIAVITSKEGGYTAHKDGPINSGWVRDLGKTGKRNLEKRWHAKEVKNHIEIHLDVTHGYHHKVEVHKAFERQERKRLNEIRQKMFPNYIPTVEKKISSFPLMKVEWARNSLEIQRSLKPKKSLIKKVLSFFKI